MNQATAEQPKDYNLVELAEIISKYASTEDLEAIVAGRTYHEYANDPVAFGEDHFGDKFTDEVQKLMLSVRDNPVTIGISANATGKSHAAARVAIWWLKSFDDCQVYTAAAPPESNLKKILWGEIGELTEKYPDFFKAENISSLHIEKSKKRFLTGVTIPTSGNEKTREAKFSGKHSPHLLFIIDEGDAVPDEVYSGIESCMSGGHIRLLILFNPRQRAGEAYRMIQEGRANVVRLTAFGHPNVITGQDIIPGAVDRETTVRRINQWTRPWVEGESFNKDNSFIVPAFLQGATAINPSTREPYPPLIGEQRRIITSPSFSYMVLGQYPAMGVNQLISSDWIYRARTRWDDYVAKFGEVFPDGTRPIMGLDAAEFGPDSNCAYFRAGGYVSRANTWDKVDVLVTGDKGARLMRDNNGLCAFVDGNGVGAGVAPHMRRKGVEAYSVKVQESPTTTTEMGEFKILRDQLGWSLREWLRTDPGAMLPPDDILIEELMVPTYEIDRGKIRIMRRDDMKEALGRSPDRFSSLCLTFTEASPEDVGSGYSYQSPDAARTVEVVTGTWAEG